MVPKFQPAEKEYVFFDIYLPKGLFAEHAWGAFVKSFLIREAPK